MAIINGRIQRRVSRRNADINMTNLMDVMMVLLVVFMVAAPLMTSGIPLDLPKVGGGTLNGKDTSINISVDKDGFYSKITLVPDQHNILITGVNSKKFLLFDLEKMSLIKKQPALIDVSNIIIMDKTKVQDL